MNESLLKLASAVIYSDGEVLPSEIAEFERYTLLFDKSLEEIESFIKQEIETIAVFNEAELLDYIAHAALTITNEELKYKTFDFLLQIALSDRALDDYETILLSNIAQYLQIPTYYFANNLAYWVKYYDVEVFCQSGYEVRDEDDAKI